LRGGGNALEAVIAAVMVLEDDALFNAGYGSVLTTAGRVEMDAAVMMARRLRGISGASARVEVRAGGVVLVNRVRNPILLARAVMEHTAHVLMGGAGAHRIARAAGVPLCRPEDLVSLRARQRWKASLVALGAAKAAAHIDGDAHHGTVGAVAVDAQGVVAAATSTGGVTGKRPGRIGDSAIIGAGLFAGGGGAASATGAGEAIIKAALCRDTVMRLGRLSPQVAAARAVARLHQATGAQAGVIVVDRNGRLGYAHNADAMETALFDPAGGIRYLVVPQLKLPRLRAGTGRR
jgi:beta-aspartyl-peptidase (threonine type)